MLCIGFTNVQQLPEDDHDRSKHVGFMTVCVNIRGSSQKKCTERNTYRIEHQMCGKVL